MDTREIELFEDLRGRLEAIAYRMLGSASDAEDAVQDTFLRWQAVDRHSVRTPAAWLTTALTNVCLNRLTSARARRGPGARPTWASGSPDDRARSSVITGRPAARIKEFICAGAAWSVAHPTVLLPSRRQRVTGESGRLSPAS